MNKKSNVEDFKKYALFFAVSNYADSITWNHIKNPVMDARAIAGVLKKYYNFDTTIYENPSLFTIEQTLAEWQHMTFEKDAQLFVFFSGHGYYYEPNETGYFVPKDGEGNDYRTFRGLREIGNEVTQIPCKHILLAIDACYAGTIDQDQEIALESKSLEGRPGENKRTFRENLIRSHLEFQSRLFITSGGKERTLDGVIHSPFANAFLSGLSSTYSHGDGLFTFQDLLAKLNDLHPTPHHGQLPNHENGEFVFISKERRLE